LYDVPRARKKNVHYIFASQVPQSLYDTVCGKVLAGNYSTFIALANNDCDDDARRAYAAFGLQSHEIDIISALPKRRHLALIKHKAKDDHNSELVSFHAEAMGDVFPILQGGRKRYSVMRSVKAQLVNTGSLADLLTTFKEKYQCAI
jgi:type IV secretory pathway VirB4 component